MKVIYEGSTYECDSLMYDDDNDLVLDGKKADAEKVTIVVGSYDIKAEETNANGISTATINVGGGKVSVTCETYGVEDYSPATWNSPFEDSFVCNDINVIEATYTDESEKIYDVELEESVINELINVFTF